MANTSRKRPPPAPTAAANGARNGAPPSTAVVGGISGIDALLAKYARSLPPGASVTVKLVKGPSSSSVDPIAARRAAAKAARAQAAAGLASSGASSGNDSDGGGAAAAGRGIAAPLSFPRMAKFGESVTPPDFFVGSLKDGRMYEEEVPKAKDESDEEESTAYKPSGATEGEGSSADPNNAASDASKNVKKKRRWRRNDPRPRRWVLQEKSEFFDRIRKRKQRGSTGTGDEDDGQVISNQYHGVVEANASKYVILSVAPQPSSPAPVGAAQPGQVAATEQISIQPIHGFHAFSQPYKFASLTMEEAESAIEKQRNVVTRYMMHGKLAAENSSNEARAALATGVATVGGRGSRGLKRSIGPAPKAMSRARLLGKLAGGGVHDEEDADDVMGDVRFSSSGSRGSSRARKELLSSLGDEGVTVDDDGVLGGANDSEFGGRRRFARVAVNKEGDSPGKKGGGGGTKATSTGFEAGAMEEGFYQRDVAAEYEALDYDANEQFDDDDVNVGEDEIHDDGGGYGGDFNDSGGDDDMLDSDEEGEGSDDDGLRGMATASGLRAMLARARGESPTNHNTNGVDASAAAASLGAGLDAGNAEDGDVSAGAGGAGGGKGLDRMLDAAKKAAEEMEKKKVSSTTSALEDKNSASSSTAAAAGAASATGSAATGVAEMGIEKDKDGKRLITLEAVRREIWLNNGAITSKRLTKKFDVTKKNPERQALFKTIVMELCTIKKDADGNKLVLKQHYSKI